MLLCLPYRLCPFLSLSCLVGHRQLRVLAAPVVHDVFGDERAQSTRSSSSRTSRRLPSEVTRDPWKSTFKQGIPRL